MSRQETIVADLKDQLEALTEESFLKPYVMNGEWFQVDSPDGIWWVECLSYLPDNEDFDLDGARQVKGWGAWMSAPGYMDRTETVVFGSEKEALEYLVDWLQ